MNTLRYHIILWSVGALLLLLPSGCAALRGEDSVGARRDYDPNQDGIDYYDEMDDYYYEYMGY